LSFREGEWGWEGKKGNHRKRDSHGKGPEASGLSGFQGSDTASRGKGYLFSFSVSLTFAKGRNAEGKDRGGRRGRVILLKLLTLAWKRVKRTGPMDEPRRATRLERGKSEQG